MLLKSSDWTVRFLIFFTVSDWTTIRLLRLLDIFSLLGNNLDCVRACIAAVKRRDGHCRLGLACRTYKWMFAEHKIILVDGIF